MAGENQFGEFEMSGTLAMDPSAIASTAASTGTMKMIKKYTQMWSPHANIRPKQKRIYNLQQKLLSDYLSQNSRYTKMNIYDSKSA